MAEQNKWRKIGTLIFLAMMVIGFSIPAFLDPTAREAAVQQPNQKLCQTDADCYLLCDDKPVEILCSQNLCLHDSCGQNVYYRFTEIPLTFSLHIEVDEASITLGERNNPGNVFVRFKDDTIQVFSFGLSLRHILEKAGILLSSECLAVDGKQYCNDDTKRLQIMVNGNESSLYEKYVPQESDSVEIVYS